jgi:hypothetical protein
MHDNIIKALAIAAIGLVAPLYGTTMYVGPTAPMFSPSGTSIVVDVSGISTPSEQSVIGNGYLISFNVAQNVQGVVRGTDNAHTTPVAGYVSGSSEYLTNGFGSLLTTDVASSGNYLSTGTGTITITFSSPQRSLALDWGSIDTANILSFNDAAATSITGAQIKGSASAVLPLGSDYVVVNTDSPFTTVTARSSGGASFEFAGLVASNAALITPSPEPRTGILIAVALIAYLVWAIRKQIARTYIGVKSK